jgi:heme/copper-type cytochrome/quinol oxidase subunit 2
MMDLTALGKILLGLGGVLLLLGAALLFAGRLSGAGAIGRLPGDILIKRDNFTFYFPIATGILVSIVLSLLMWLVFFIVKR